MHTPPFFSEEWVLAFGKDPPLLEFPLLSAGRPCEVLLALEPPTSSRTKTGRPSGPRQRPSRTALADIQTPSSARVEARLGGLEAKQDSLADKVETQFVSVQLSRILGAVSKPGRACS